MLFNSAPFLIFLPVVFGLYWLPVKKNWWQNAVLIAASLFFYAYWDWRVIGLFIGSIVFTMLMAKKIAKVIKTEGGGRIWLVISIVVLIGILAVFKYYNFFAGSLADMFNISPDSLTLSLVLPLGISFYTFMCVSYLSDSYTGKVNPLGYSIFSTFSYLSFFAQIVSGPIGRGPHMLPQFAMRRRFDSTMAINGICRFVYGLFQKMVVADVLAGYVNSVMAMPSIMSGEACLISMLLYSVQIYCDFCGYSNMAIGVSNLFGLRLIENFEQPYHAGSFSEFWRRWHISLSSWFRDYVYIPLGGSRCSTFRQIANLWVVFLLSGLWHGASWMFVAWGGVHAFFLTLGVLRKKILRKLNLGGIQSTLLNKLVVFVGVSLAWTLFRAESLVVAKGFFKQLFIEGSWRFSFRALCAEPGFATVFVFLSMFLFIIVPDNYFIVKKKSFCKILYCVSLILMIVLIGVPPTGEFVYARF